VSHLLGVGRRDVAPRAELDVVVVARTGGRVGRDEVRQPREQVVTRRLVRLGRRRQVACLLGDPSRVLLGDLTTDDLAVDRLQLAVALLGLRQRLAPQPICGQQRFDVDVEAARRAQLLDAVGFAPDELDVEHGSRR
jgi:hypothetical protein